VDSTREDTEGNSSSLTETGDGSPDTAASDTADTDPGSTSTFGCIHRAFLTNARFNGNLGGLAGADSKCDTEAAVGLAKGTLTALGGGTSWKAILSAPGSSAKDRLRICGEVYDNDGNLVASDADDLWDGSIANAIDTDPNGEAIAARVWTGSQPTAGVAAWTCSSWTVANGFGVTGQNWSTKSFWLGSVRPSELGPCKRGYYLYCLEQP